MALRAYTYNLFGAPPLPALTSVQARLSALLFHCGSRYLGDEDSLVRDPVKALNASPPLGPKLPSQWGGLVRGARGGSKCMPWIELAVMGRSNAGKSTLLNALLQSKQHQQAQQNLKAFVPVSRKPGTTVRLDFYGMGQAPTPALVLVDTPGYGFSIRGKERHGVWMDRMAEYLRTRRTMSSGPSHSPLLARVMVLADVRLGLTDLDHSVLEALDDARLPSHVVLTKADLVGDSALALTVRNTSKALAAYKMPFPHLSVVAAQTGLGVGELSVAIMHTTKLHRLREDDFAAHVSEIQGREQSQP